MSFQEFVNSGFGLWTPDYTHVNRVKKQRRDFESMLNQQTSEHCSSIKAEERESTEQLRLPEVRENEDLELMTLSLVENRNELIKKMEKSVEAMKELEAENERMRAENENLKAENAKWKSHVEKLITDTRVSLEEIRRQASETVRLQKENETLRNENTYRHLIMKQMKKRSKVERNNSVFKMIGQCG